MTSQPNFSRAPFHMRYTRKSDFEPKFVSIGPHFYNEPKSLKEMEKTKSEFIKYFLGNQREYDFAELVKSVSGSDPNLENKIHEWYGGKNKIALEGTELFEMLVRDSCFIIRIIIYLSREANNMVFPGVDVRIVRIDLLLLESQIPYFFLKKVYKFLKEKNLFPTKPSLDSPEAGANQPTQQRPICSRCCLRRNDMLSASPEENHTNQSPPPDQANSLCCLSYYFKRNGMHSGDLAPQEDNHINQSPSQRQTCLPCCFKRNGMNSSPRGENHINQPPPEGQTYQCCLPCCFKRNGMNSAPREGNHLNQSTPRSQIRFPLPCCLRRNEMHSAPHQEENHINQSDQGQPNDMDEEFLKELEPFIGLDMPWQYNEYGMLHEPDHLLDLYWKCCLPFHLDDEGIYSRRLYDGNLDTEICMKAGSKFTSAVMQPKRYLMRMSLTGRLVLLLRRENMTKVMV